jgi:hypothetical protein
MPFLGWRSFSLSRRTLEAVTILREVDGLWRGAEDRNVGGLQGAGELQRRLAARTAR